MDTLSVSLLVFTEKKKIQLTTGLVNTKPRNKQVLFN